MPTVAAADARRNSVDLVQQADDDLAPREVDSRQGNPALVTKDDHDAITGTAYVLRNANGATRLIASLERARRGEFETHELSEA